ncbi:MAG: hypothetical protein DMF61_07750 [Blastocatellia bacterium AA13]|nr:MAG: hypothetical protein DMF61_07750 [Blastocatellia bacterium AA13]
MRRDYLGRFRRLTSARLFETLRIAGARLIARRGRNSRGAGATDGRPYIVLISSVGIALCLFSGCKSTDAKDARRYDLVGKVVSFDSRGRTITIAHEDIPGYMPAMTMPFTARDEWVYRELAEGDRIQATLAVSGARSWLEDIVVSRVEAAPASSSCKTSPHLPDAGEIVPSLSLINQDGKPIDIARFRGRALLITFIYTRCPLPDYCPLMTANFAALRREMRAGDSSSDSSGVHLLSITIDPAYDSPRVLREYGQKAGADFAQWEFATGTTEQVKAAADWFGMSCWPENGQIVHSLSTALIGPDGNLVKLYRGSDWKVDDVSADIKNVLAKEHASSTTPGE